MEKNEFTDQTYDEIIKTRTGFNPEKDPCVNTKKGPKLIREEVDIEEEILDTRPRRSELCYPKVIFDDGSSYGADYRRNGSVTAVKNQQKCSSCWAFAAAGVIEAQHFMKTGNLLPFSEQNLVDCVPLQTPSCEGGSMTRAFEYVKREGGINPENSYPYQNNQFNCRFNPAFALGRIRDYVEINRGNEEKLIEYQIDKIRNIRSFYEIVPGNEEQLRRKLDEVGPIAVGLYAFKGFQYYKSGVLYHPGCAKLLVPNHAVLLVGYGETPKGEKFWLAKNSYGVGWGENGYVRIARNKNNHCEIATYASYAF